jgi:hypothetical protein
MGLGHFDVGIAHRAPRSRRPRGASGHPILAQASINLATASIALPEHEPQFSKSSARGDSSMPTVDETEGRPKAGSRLEHLLGQQCRPRATGRWRFRPHVA